MPIDQVTGVAGVLFGVLLGTACLKDVRDRRIPNTTVMFLLVLGVGITAARAPGWRPIIGSLGGAATGLALWLPFWFTRVIGAGDVKLFAAASAWLGPGLSLEAALLAALYGGAVSLVFMIRGQGASYTFVRLAHAIRQPLILRDTGVGGASRRIPYGLAIAGGAATAAWFPGILL